MGVDSCVSVRLALVLFLGASAPGAQGLAAGFLPAVVHAKHGVFQATNQFFATSPIVSTVVVATSRGLAGDIIAQKLESKFQKPPKSAQSSSHPQSLQPKQKQKFALNLKRLALYGIWTNFAAITIDWVVFAVLTPRWFPTMVDGHFRMINVWKACAFDNLIVTPFFFYPLFYIFKNCFMSTQSVGVIGALRNYRQDLWAQLGATWAVWVPMHLLMFSVVPPHLRVLFVSVVGVGYVTLLSMVTQYCDNR